MKQCPRGVSLRRRRSVHCYFGGDVHYWLFRRGCSLLLEIGAHYYVGDAHCYLGMCIVILGGGVHCYLTGVHCYLTWVVTCGRSAHCYLWKGCALLLVDPPSPHSHSCRSFRRAAELKNDTRDSLHTHIYFIDSIIKPILIFGMG